MRLCDPQNDSQFVFACWFKCSGRAKYVSGAPDEDVVGGKYCNRFQLWHLKPYLNWRIWGVLLKRVSDHVPRVLFTGLCGSQYDFLELHVNLNNEWLSATWFLTELNRKLCTLDIDDNPSSSSSCLIRIEAGSRPNSVIILKKTPVH